LKCFFPQVRDPPYTPPPIFYSSPNHGLLTPPPQPIFLMALVSSFPGSPPLTFFHIPPPSATVWLLSIPYCQILVGYLLYSSLLFFCLTVLDHPLPVSLEVVFPTPPPRLPLPFLETPNRQLLTLFFISFSCVLTFRLFCYPAPFPRDFLLL